MALTITDAQVKTTINAWWAAAGAPTLDGLRAAIAAAWAGGTTTRVVGCGISGATLTIDLEETTLALVTTARTLTWTTAIASPARGDGLTLAQVYAGGGTTRVGDAVALGWGVSRSWASVALS